MTRADLAWAAGLFEGEGTFVSGTRARPQAALAMTDKETVARFAEIVGFGPVWGPYRNGRAGYKPMYRWATWKFEHTQAIGAMLWPWLSLRRREQFKTVLAAYHSAPIRRFRKAS